MGVLLPVRHKDRRLGLQLHLDLAAVQRRGLRIPRDIAIMTFDDHPFSALCVPFFFLVDIDVREMGAQAGKFLLSAIKKPNLQSQTHTATPNLIVRASTVEGQG